MAPTTLGRVSEQGGRSGDKDQAQACCGQWVSKSSFIPHHSCLSQSEKVSRETQPSPGILTTLWGDYDGPTVAMPTVLSLPSSFHLGGFFSLFLRGHPFTSVCPGADQEVSPCHPLAPGKLCCLDCVALRGAAPEIQASLLPGWLSH